MRAYGFVAIAMSFIAAILMHRADARLQLHRDPKVAETAFRLVPIRWLRAGLYSGEGEKLRFKVLALWIATAVLFLIGAVILTRTG